MEETTQCKNHLDWTAALAPHVANVTLAEDVASSGRNEQSQGSEQRASTVMDKVQMLRRQLQETSQRLETVKAEITKIDSEVSRYKTMEGILESDLKLLWDAYIYILEQENYHLEQEVKSLKGGDTPMEFPNIEAIKEEVRKEAQKKSKPIIVKQLSSSVISDAERSITGSESQLYQPVNPPKLPDSGQSRIQQSFQLLKDMKPDKAEWFKHRKLSEAIKELRVEEAPVSHRKVRQPKVKTKKVKKEIVVQSCEGEAIEPLAWLDVSLCTAPVSFFSSQKKRGIKTVCASELRQSQPPEKSEGSVAEVEALSEVDAEEASKFHSTEKSEGSVAEIEASSDVDAEEEASKFYSQPPEKSEGSVAEVAVKEETSISQSVKQELVTMKTLSQEIGTYLRMYHEFRNLRLEQIDMKDLCVEEKERQKTDLERLQHFVVDSVKEIMTDAKNGVNLETLLKEVKDGMKRVEEHTGRVKDEIELDEARKKKRPE